MLGPTRVISAVAAGIVVLTSCTGDDGERSSDPGKGPPSPVVSRTPIAKVTQPADGWFESACELDPDLVERVVRGYYPERSPDVLYVPREPNQFPNNHSGPWDYLQEVPLLLYGPGYIKTTGNIALEREVTVADLAPTFAELIGTPWPSDRAGRVLDEVLVSEQDRETPPRLLLTVVWDGGGTSVLESWPDAWPQLNELSEKGAYLEGATVGSSPSITPAVHTTIGTGTFPNQHGVVDILYSEGDQMVKSFNGKSPAAMRIPTLADMYDAEMANEPLVGVLAYKGWHLGMMGQGAYLEGGDQDIAGIVTQTGTLATNSSYYSLPGGGLQGGLSDDVRRTDASDGKLDGKWMGNEVLGSKSELRDTPVWVYRETELLQQFIREERFGKDDVPDLFYINYKQIDQVGHRWGMLEPEMQNMIVHTDSQLEGLVAFLDEWVGRGRWVMALTADHGPSPDLGATAGWPIHMPVFQSDLWSRFGGEEVFLDERASGLWFRETAADLPSPESVADFVIDYRIEDDLPEGQELPTRFADRRLEPVFSAAWPAEALAQVSRCSGTRPD
ncbi:MAG: alkaline phosphatase family protein [Actinomycetota bacterium]|nr:alkaline phosphatase family protein [Actinomycetota bacterium]